VTVFNKESNHKKNNCLNRFTSVGKSAEASGWPLTSIYRQS